jgi:hypothetical protein
MDFVLSTSCSNIFSKQLFTLTGSVVGAGIAVTMALHLCLICIPVFSSYGFVPLLHDEKKICDAAESIVICPCTI